MNKRGFTLVELLATIVIIGLIMAVVLPSATRMSGENKETIYETYESMIEEYAAVSEYRNLYYIDIDDLDELNKVKKECDGYVLIDHETDVPSYKAYITCEGKYTTDGYADGLTNIKKVDVPICNANLVYNGAEQELVSTGLGYKLANQKRRDVGKQDVTAIIVNKQLYAWSDDNTQDNKIIRNCEIKQREIKIVAENKSMRYGETVPTFTYNIQGGLTTENPLLTNVTFTIKNSSNATVTPSSTLPVGDYQIIPSATVTSNYYINSSSGFVKGTFSVTRSLFTITLNNGSATTAGTTAIYERYNKNWFKNSDGTGAITSITVPTKNGYVFQGYYTGTNGSGTQAIDSGGTILLATNAYEENVTLYAKWGNCGNGYYCSGGVKTGCPAGYYGNGAKNGTKQSESCKECGNGYFCSGVNTRKECPAGYYGNGQTTGGTRDASCKICDKGYYCTGIDNKTACGDGKYNDLEGQSSPAACKNINAGCYGTSGTTACPQACGDGKWSNPGSSSCSNIKAGCYGSSGTNDCPNACGDGKYSIAGSSSCSNIKAGCYGTSASSDCPNKCSPGTYSNAGASSCSACGGGKYSGEGAGSCTNITAGCYGTSASTACPNKCSPGTYSNAGASSCTACGGGKWSNKGASSCSNINAGCYGTSASSACPNACGGGKYSTGGASSCSNITAGCYGTSASKACPNECPAGTYSGSGASSCSNCNSGKYSTGTKNTSCKSCPSYYYSGTSGAQTSCYDNSAPVVNGWNSLSETNTVINTGSAATTLCSLGTDNGSTSGFTVYYRTSCTGSWSTASVSGGCARLSLGKCSGGTLYYYLYDGRNSSSTISVGNIPKWLLISQAYTQLLRGGGAANSEMAWHYNRGIAVSTNVYDICSSVEANGLSNSTFNSRLYPGILGRSTDTNYWLNQLNSGVSRATVCTGLVTSKEAKSKYSGWGQS